MEKESKVWMVVKQEDEISVISNNDELFDFCSRTAAERLEDGCFEIIYSTKFRHFYIIKYVHLDRDKCEKKMEKLEKLEEGECGENTSYYDKWDGMDMY